MDDQRWPVGACVLFAVVTSLALWAVIGVALVGVLG